MSYTISYNQSIDAVTISVASPSVVSEHIHGKAEVVRLCFEKKCYKALVDLYALSAVEDLTKTELYEFSEEDTGLADFEKQLAIAIVLPEKKEDQDQMYFLVNLMKINALNIKTFYQRDEALDWLQQVPA